MQTVICLHDNRFYLKTSFLRKTSLQPFRDVFGHRGREQAQKHRTTSMKPIASQSNQSNMQTSSIISEALQ